MTFLVYPIGALFIIMVSSFGIIGKKKKRVLRALEMLILSYPVVWLSSVSKRLIKDKRFRCKNIILKDKEIWFKVKKASDKIFLKKVQ